MNKKELLNLFKEHLELEKEIREVAIEGEKRQPTLYKLANTENIQEIEKYIYRFGYEFKETLNNNIVLLDIHNRLFIENIDLNILTASICKKIKELNEKIRNQQQLK